MAAPSEDDETAEAVSTQLAKVDVDRLGRRALELPIERNWLGVSFVAHDDLFSGIYNKSLPRL